MTRGFAFATYPAEYRSSGVMTFIVNQDGIVYEKDRGVQTIDIAQHLGAYDSDETSGVSSVPASVGMFQIHGAYNILPYGFSDVPPLTT